MGGRLVALLGVLALYLAGAPTASAAGPEPAGILAKPAATVAVPQFADIVLDEPHGLLYGSDRAGGKVWVLALSALSTVATIDVGPSAQPLGIDLTLDGSMLAVARSGSGDIALVDTAARAVSGTLVPLGGTGAVVPADVRLGRTGRLYSVGNTSGTDFVHVFDTTSRKEVGRSTDLVRTGPRIAITGDHNRLFVAESSFSSFGLLVTRFDITTDTPTSTATGMSSLGVHPWTTAIAVKPDGSRVYVSSGETFTGDLGVALGGAQGGPAVAYSPAKDLAFFARIGLAETEGTTAARVGSRPIAGTGATALRVNAANTVAYVASSAGLEAIALDIPAAAEAVDAQPGIGSAVVFWTPPVDTGASPITGYDVVASTGASAHVGAGATSVVLTGLLSTIHTFTVAATNAQGTGPAATASNQVTPLPGGTFHTLAPTRVLDTRDGTGGMTPGPIGPGGSVTFTVAGRGGVPSDLSQVTAVVMNVTVVDTTGFSFLTVFPAGLQRPAVSNLNWAPGQTVANLVVVALGPGGQVTIFNDQGQTDVIFDVAGWVGSNINSSGPSGMFNALAPSRLLDTRTDGGGPIGPGGTRSLQVTGRGGVPSSGVSAVVLNVTVTEPTAASFVTVWPAGETRPVVSNLNLQPGQTRPNRVMVKVGAGGVVDIFNDSGSAHVVVDVNGWYTDATNTVGGSALVATLPGRFFDTRDPRFLNPPAPLPPGATGKLTLAPDQRQMTGLILNVTSVNAAAPTFLTLFPDGQPLPLASDLNPVPGQTIPNLTVVRLSATFQGSFDTFNNAHGGSVDVVMDAYGFYGGVVQPLTVQVTVRASETPAAPADLSPGVQTGH